jgi:DNA-binding response OmpR family regulator
MPLATILLVAAHERRAWALQRLLNDAGYLTMLACTEAKGLAELRAQRPTLLVVDRATSTSTRISREVLTGHPSLVITLHTHESDCTGDHAIRDLEDGAHVSLCNPSPRLLVAMIRTMLRREEAARHAPPVAVVNRIQIDVDRHEVRVDHQLIDLTPKEFLLLQTLLEHPDRVCSRQTLQDRVWGAGYAVSHNVVSVYMHLLRRKLERDPSRPRLLWTMPGVGYKLQADLALASAAPRPRRPVRREVVRDRLAAPRGRSDAQARRSSAAVG